MTGTRHERPTIKHLLIDLDDTLYRVEDIPIIVRRHIESEHASVECVNF